MATERKKQQDRERMQRNRQMDKETIERMREALDWISENPDANIWDIVKVARMAMK